MSAPKQKSTELKRPTGHFDRTGWPQNTGYDMFEKETSAQPLGYGGRDPMRIIPSTGEKHETVQGIHFVVCAPGQMS